MDPVVSLHVELPAYSHSFTVGVPASSSVLDLKQEISRTCPGRPRVDGQRLIYKGRVLSDAELIVNVWKASHETKIVHLAVHPSAWVDSPPQHMEPPLSSTSSVPVPRPGSGMFASLTPPSANVLGVIPNEESTMATFSFITILHSKALHALSSAELDRSTALTELELTESRRLAYDGLYSYGIPWPAVFDASFPESSDGQSELKYERVIESGRAYLALKSGSEPTAQQRHALRVLTYTYPLLSLPPYPNPTLPLYPPAALHLNAHLHQHNLPLLREVQFDAAHRNAFAVELRGLPVRALVPPLIMLALRTLLLFYFFSPARKPLFGIIIGAWMLYEAWGAIRGIVDDDGQEARRNMAAAVVQPANNAQRGALNLQQPPPRADGTHAPGEQRPQTDLAVNMAAELYLRSEETALTAPDNAIPMEVNRVHQLQAFVTLFLGTLHPAVWNRRRNLLRQREGRVRTEANAAHQITDASLDAEERERRTQSQTRLTLLHQSRPRWVRDYVDRVMRSDWIDE